MKKDSLIGDCRNKNLNSFRHGDKEYSMLKVIKKYKFLLWSVVIGAFIYCCVAFPFENNLNNKKWEKYITIAHAGGILDEYVYSNCEEAILKNYKEGHRVFEIDLALTSDDKIVGKHEWSESFQAGLEEGKVPTEEEFLNIPLWGKYKPLSFKDLCEIMNEYEDIWIVTDSKSRNDEYNKKFFNIMVSTAKELGMEHVLKRMIIQLYDKEMLDVVSEVYPFESYILTLYLLGFSGDKNEFMEYVRYCSENDIDAITMWGHLFNSDLGELAEQYGIKVYVHTLNDINKANEAFECGVTGIYTDSLTPDILDRE